jgi:hypothetical protein
MTEHRATISILDPTLPGYVSVRAATTAEPATPPLVSDDLVNATEATP